MASAVGVDPAQALEAAGKADVGAESIATMLEEIHRPAVPAVPEAGSLADEIERINKLRGITANDRLRMISVILGLHEERAAAEEGR